MDWVRTGRGAGSGIVTVTGGGASGELRVPIETGWVSEGVRAGGAPTSSRMKPLPISVIQTRLSGVAGLTFEPLGRRVLWATGL